MISSYVFLIGFELLLAIFFIVEFDFYLGLRKYRKTMYPKIRKANKKANKSKVLAHKGNPVPPEAARIASGGISSAPLTQASKREFFSAHLKSNLLR